MLKRGWREVSIRRLRNDDGNVDVTSTGRLQPPCDITAHDFVRSPGRGPDFTFAVLTSCREREQNNGYCCQYKHDMSER